MPWPDPQNQLAFLNGAILLLGVLLYALLGGADFGGGIWDLLAGGPRAGEQRKVIANAIGPIWEANHVWLIFVIVLVFTVFPPVFAALSIALYIPLSLALLGIVFRGAAFIFRTPARNVATGPVSGTASSPSPAPSPRSSLACARGRRLGADPARQRDAGQRSLAHLAGALSAGDRSARSRHLCLPRRRLSDAGDHRGIAGRFPAPRPGSGSGLRRAGGARADSGAKWRPLDLARSHQPRRGSRCRWASVSRSSPAGRSSHAAIVLARVAAAAEVALLLAGWALAQYPTWSCLT